MNVFFIHNSCNFRQTRKTGIILREHASGGVDEGNEFEILRAGNLDDTRRIGDDGRQKDARGDSGGHDQQCEFGLEFRKKTQDEGISRDSRDKSKLKA